MTLLVADCPECHETKILDADGWCNSCREKYKEELDKTLDEIFGGGLFGNCD